MTSLLNRVRTEDQGVLTFEWVLLLTVLIIGIVGGLSAVRDALIDELGDVAGAAVAMDQGYTVTACQFNNANVPDCLKVTAANFGFTDALPNCAPQSTGGRVRKTPAQPNQTAVQACKQ